MNTLQETKRFFEESRPQSSSQEIRTQFAVHIEEIGEMLEAVDGSNSYSIQMLHKARELLKNISHDIRVGKIVYQVPDRKALADSLADQLVTAVGVAHCENIDIIGALNEVNRSNESKKVDGEYQKDLTGKITKGPNYSPPDLTPYV